MSDSEKKRPNLPAEGPAAAAASAEAEQATCDSVGATQLCAVVDRDGNLVRGLHAVSASRAPAGSTGWYEVIFDRNVRKCCYVATIGLPGNVGVEEEGEITVAGRFNNQNGVFITTHDSNGNYADRSFHLVVICPQCWAK